MIFFLFTKKGDQSWTIINPQQDDQNVPSSRRLLSSILYNSNEIIIFGGRCTSQEPLFFNDLYSFKENKWKTLKNEGEVPSPRCGSTAVENSDKMIIFGGMFLDKEGNSIYYDDLYSYDLCKFFIKFY